MVKIYTTPTCPYCKLAKEFMTQHNIAFQELDVSQDEQALNEMVQKTGQLGVPVLDIDGQIMVGFNRKKLGELLGIKV
ncbi:MAG: glutaredoxin family protein [Candidatus Paceibacteria bacterium]